MMTVLHYPSNICLLNAVLERWQECNFNMLINILF